MTKKHLWVPGFGFGLLVAIGAHAQTLTALPPPSSAPVSDFDGSYTGLQRLAERLEMRSPHGYSPGPCSTSLPPKLTIQNGTASMTWCLGACTLTGQVDKTGHIDMPIPDNPGRPGSVGVMVVQLYPKGTNEFDARGQYHGYACRYVLTWRKAG